MKKEVKEMRILFLSPAVTPTIDLAQKSSKRKPLCQAQCYGEVNGSCWDSLSASNVNLDQESLLCGQGRWWAGLLIWSTRSEAAALVFKAKPKLFASKVQYAGWVYQQFSYLLLPKSIILYHHLHIVSNLFTCCSGSTRHGNFDTENIFESHLPF